MTLSNDDKKRLRGIGHRLDPVVTIAAKGLSASVVQELERALNDHELIKIRLALPTRAERTGAITEICRQCGAELVQVIGHTALLLRGSNRPNPRLSRLPR